jgi:hypothetical protein
MARGIIDRNLSPILAAARTWIDRLRTKPPTVRESGSSPRPVTKEDLRKAIRFLKDRVEATEKVLTAQGV